MTTDKRDDRELSARVSALRGPRPENDLTRDHETHEFVQDSLTRTKNKDGLRSSYITPGRAQKVIRDLRDRDRSVVELLETVQLASGAQIRRLLWGEGASVARQARRQLAKLTALRVVARQDQRVGGVRSGSEGYAYSLDVVGQLVTGRTMNRRRPRPVGLPFIAHALSVTDCYVLLRELHDQRTVELIHFETEPACWRGFSGPGGARLTLKPDAFVITAQGDYEDRWFLEIDRCTESPSRLQRKAQIYCYYYRSGREQTTSGVFPRVLWVVPSEHRAGQLVGVLAKLEPENWEIFQVVTTDHFVDVMASGAGDTPETES